MAEDFFGDITEAPKEDFFGDVKPVDNTRGIVDRTVEGFKGNYHPVLEGAADKLVDKEQHPYLHKATELAVNANPLSWIDKGFAAVTGAAGAGAGALAGAAEQSPTVAGAIPGERFGKFDRPLSKAEADRLQRDATIIGQGLMVEPGMGLAAARAPKRLPDTQRPAEAPPARPAAEAVPERPPEAPGEPAVPAPVPASGKPVYDAITGERVDMLPEVARSELAPEPVAETPTIADKERQTPTIADKPATPDFFADLAPMEEPPARVTERIPDEAVAAGEPAESVSESQKVAESVSESQKVAESVSEKPAGKPKKEKRPQSMTEYIAANGGLELTPEARDMGLHRKLVPRAGNVARKTGKSIDGFWRERLMEEGYLDRDPDGGMARDIRGELYEKLRLEQEGKKQYSNQDRAPEAAAVTDERAPAIEKHAKTIEDAFRQEGLSRDDLSTEALYEGADLMYRGEAKDPFEAYDRAATRLEERDAQPRGARGASETVYPAGGERAGPRVEKALPGTSQGREGARPVRRIPRSEVRPEQVTDLQQAWENRLGHGVESVESVPLRTALAEMQTSHLSPDFQRLTESIAKRLAKVTGDTPVHRIAERDLKEYYHNDPKSPENVAGFWSSESGAKARDFIALNADHAADPRTNTHTVLHEAVHAAAYGAIEAKPALRRAIRIIMEDSKATTKRNGIANHEKVYAFKDEQEFLAESLSNNQLQKILLGLPASPRVVAALGGKGRIRTMWDAFVETVRRAVGFEPRVKNMLEAILKVGERVTREKVALTEEGSAKMAISREARKALRNKRAGKEPSGLTAEDFAEMDKEMGVKPGERPTVEPGADNKPQSVLPGAERVSEDVLARRKVAAELARRKAQERIAPKVAQKPMDEGLFGEGHKQTDLFDAPKNERTELFAPAGGTPPATGTQPSRRFMFGRRVGQSYKEMFQPELISEEALRADPLFAKRASVRAQEHDQILREGAKRYTQWNKIPEQQRIDFLGQVERGQPTAPEFRGIAQVYRRMLDQAYKMEKQWGSKAGYVADYFPHLWERPAPGQAPIAAFMEARIRALGPTWFQKARTFDLIEEGLAAGYKLRSTNPEALMNMRLMSGADMRANMQLLNELRGMDLAVKVAETNRGADALARAGWQKINAADREQWMISPDVQALWKNGVESKGLWANEGLTGDAFRAWMGFKNVWIPVKLAASAFHPLHVVGINLAHNWAKAADQVMAGHIGGAMMSIGRGVSPYQGIGKRARAAWVMGESARTPEGKLAVKTMNEGGFSPMLSEQLRIDAGRKFSDALRAGNPLKMGYHGLRLGIQKAQSAIFEHWIPHLKAAAYLNDAAAVLRRNPELNNDPIKRGVALRAIAKSVDNRFGEMFYGTLFWNRMAKDISISSFLSLGWNLGFVREFGGAAMESLTRPASLVKKPSETRQIIRDSTNKIKFAGIYLGTSALLGAAITYAFTGKEPEEANDYIFPRAGGVNPDGSPRRFTTMSYLREGPMWAKHVQEQGGGISGAGWGTLEMFYNKLLFQPVVELMKNRSYFGAEIMDSNAPGYTQFMQALKHIGGQQLSPMSVTGAQRARETGGTKTEEAMAYLGFGPAPAYAERSAIQNRITHLYQRSVAPEARPYEEEETTHARMTARAKLLMAKQKGDPEEIAAAREAARKAGLSNTYMNELGKISTDQRMFRRLPEKHQMAILAMADEKERERYWLYASKKTRERWNAEHAPGFKHGGTPTPYVERKPRTLEEFIEKHGREPATDAEIEQFSPNDDEPTDFNPGDPTFSGNMAKLKDGGVVLSGMNHKPTDAQKEAGNYAKGEATVHGLAISIENKKGGERSGIHNGKRWSVKMPAHYGYIRGTEGADKDHVDCYLGPHLKSPKVWVIDQQDADSKKFDEHKCMLGFGSKQQALATYHKGFSDGRGPDRVHKVTELHVDKFKDWLKNGDTTTKYADGGEVEAEFKAMVKKDKENREAAAEKLLPPIGESLESKVKPAAWDAFIESRPQSENIEDRRQLNRFETATRRTGRSLPYFDAGGIV